MSNARVSPKAAAAMAAGLVCLTVYILACVASPVSWSPDGKSFVFLQSVGVKEAPDPGGAIFRCDAKSGKLTRLVESDQYLSAPAWSPDGKWICYLELGEKIGPAKAKPVLQRAGKDASGELAVYRIRMFVMKPDGTGRREAGSWMSIGPKKRQDSVMLFSGFAPVWVRDARALFTHAHLADPGGVLRVNVRTGDTEEILPGCVLPSLSPDGEWLVATHEQSKSLVVEPIAGGKRIEIQLADDEAMVGLAPPAWSLDSKAFYHFAEKKVLRIEVPSGTKTVLPGWPDEPRDVAMAPDGRLVAATVGGDDGGGGRLLFFEPHKPREARTVFTAADGAMLWQAGWSSDGSRLVVRRMDKQEGADGNASTVKNVIMIFDRAGKLQRTIDVPIVTAKRSTTKPSG